MAEHINGGSNGLFDVFSESVVGRGWSGNHRDAGGLCDDLCPPLALDGEGQAVTMNYIVFEVQDMPDYERLLELFKALREADPARPDENGKVKLIPWVIKTPTDSLQLFLTPDQADRLLRCSKMT